MKASEKIISRIKKLLATAEGKANEHESEVAARMAANLMEKYNIEMSAIIDLELKSSDSVINEEINSVEYRKWPSHISVLFSSLAKLFDCEVRYTVGSGYGHRMSVYGYYTDVEVCKWTINHIWESLHNKQQEFWKINGPTYTSAGVSPRGPCNDFLKSSVLTVTSRVRKIIASRNKIVTSSNKDLVIVKTSAIQDKYGEFTYNKVSILYDGYEHAIKKGIEAGNSVNLDGRVLKNNSKNMELVSYE